MMNFEKARTLSLTKYKNIYDITLKGVILDQTVTNVITKPKSNKPKSH